MGIIDSGFISNIHFIFQYMKLVYLEILYFIWAYVLLRFVIFAIVNALFREQMQWHDNTKACNMKKRCIYSNIEYRNEVDQHHTHSSTIVIRISNQNIWIIGNLVVIICANNVTTNGVRSTLCTTILSICPGLRRDTKTFSFEFFSNRVMSMELMLKAKVLIQMLHICQCWCFNLCDE